MSTNKTPSRKTAFTGPSSRNTTVRKNAPPASVDSQSRLKSKSVYGGTSRTILSSSSRKNVQVAGSDKFVLPTRAPVQVFDEEGRDVTPLPLTQTDPNAVRQKQSNILADSSAGTPTDLQSQTSLHQTGTVTASTFGGGPFTRSVFSASQSGRSTGSISDDFVEPSTDIAGSAWTGNLSKAKHKEEEVNEEDLEKVIDIQLSETDTIWLLDLTAVCVSAESDEATLVREQNSRYQEKIRSKKKESTYGELVKSRAGNDRYMERGMQTFNDPPKTKNVQTTKITYDDVGVMASGWDMYDTYQLAAELEAKAKAEAEEAEDDEDVSRPVSAQVEEKKDEEKGPAGPGAVSSRPGIDSRQSSRATKRSGYVSMVGFQESQATMSSMGATDSVFASKESGVTAVSEQKVSNEAAILESENLRLDMVIMERAVNLNTYQPKQASYRGYEAVPDIDKIPEVQEEPTKPKTGQIAVTVADLGPNLDRLWAYQCPLTKGRNVSCICWNKINPDLLAVGYGQFEFTKQKSGMVCCWSLKNPEFPERVYTFESGVTSLDFSLAHPNLLAVGLYDGTVAVCNVRSIKDECILDSLEASGKHTAPVWQLRWIEKERGSGEETAEVLVSISTDGRVTQWSIRKGFESYDLMKLKRIPQKQSQGRTKKAEALISKHAGGLCFDFSAKDSNIYLAGTEEGHIHRCSCSYNEQYLDSYDGHTGPVYHIEWSPFCPDIFLSCSGDWSVRLWHQDRLQPVLNFFSSTKSVPSMAWSPHVATVFACVNEGAVEVWDLSHSTLDPIIVSEPMTGNKLSSVTFARNSDCILVGDSEGAVSVFQLRCMPTSEKGAEPLQKIVTATLDNLLQQKK